MLIPKVLEFEAFSPATLGLSFPEVLKRQEVLNQKLDGFYAELSKELHTMAGLEPRASFSKDWREAELPELPGKLNPEMNKVLKEHYHKMIVLFYDLWKELLEKDSQKFYDCMMPLLGFGNRDLSQISCFYKGSYEYSYSSYKRGEPYRSALELAELKAPKEGLSSFEMQMEDCTFQVRLKPMNKFTVSGLKVNCSLKQHKSC